MKKRLIAAIVAVALVLCTLITVLIVRGVRGSPPPELSAIAPRIESLIEASHEVNEILWGEGLATYPRIYRTEPELLPFYLSKDEDGYYFSEEKTDTVLYYYVINDPEEGFIVAYRYCVRETLGPNNYVYYDVENNVSTTSAEIGNFRYAIASEPRETIPIFQHGGTYFYPMPDYQEKEAEFYYDETDEPYYDYVRADSPYPTIDSIKEKAESVYAMSYLDSIYESIFTGIHFSEGGNGTLYARYITYTDKEGKMWLLKSNTQEAKNVDRVYLYDTMRYSEKKRSHADYVYVEIETYLRGHEDERTTVRISLTLQNGKWMLDAPTF